MLPKAAAWGCSPKGTCGPEPGFQVSWTLGKIKAHFPYKGQEDDVMCDILNKNYYS